MLKGSAILLFCNELFPYNKQTINSHEAKCISVFTTVFHATYVRF
jgi:hypothetical protein